MKKLKCEFTPQAWINDYAVSVQPQGDTVFEVWWPADQEIPADFTYESDHLRFEDGVPEWIADWSGPFEIQVINRDDYEESGGS